MKAPLALIRSTTAAALAGLAATLAAPALAATAVGPWILRALGPANTILACGVVATIAGLSGMLGGPARRLGPGFAEPVPKPQ